MAAAAKEKDPENVVHQNAIFRELLAKEKRTLKLYSNFGFNPYKKNCVLSGKPNAKHDSTEDVEPDPEFLKVYRRNQNLPQERFEYPQTTAQEIGWDTQPLVSQTREDYRLFHPRRHSEITKYMDLAWQQKEQQNMQQ